MLSGAESSSLVGEERELRQVNRWASTVCEVRLLSSALVLFEMEQGEGGASRRLLCAVKNVHWNALLEQYVVAYVLAVQPCQDVSDMLVDGEDQDSATPRIWLVCRTAPTPSCENVGRQSVARCMHLGEPAADICWKYMRRDTWAPTVCKWHEFLVAKTQLYAPSPQMSLEMLDEAMKYVEIRPGQRGFLNKPAYSSDVRAYTRKTARADAVTREEHEAAGNACGQQLCGKRRRNLPSFQHKPLTVAVLVIKVLENRVLLQNLHVLLPLKRCRLEEATWEGTMKFAAHRLVVSLAPCIPEECFDVTDEESYGFVADELHNVVHGLLAWLTPRAGPFDTLSYDKRGLHWSVSWNWRGFSMSESEMKAATVQAVSMTFVHMRYLTAYVRFLKAQQLVAKDEAAVVAAVQT
ncbi:unnamed protein product [Symbiodinium sp. CCMP2592]|nr:unnamed protein product [Symbiodinium sp. CCMP2592]